MKRRTCIRAGAFAALTVIVGAPTDAMADDNALVGCAPQKLRPPHRAVAAGL